MNDSKIIQQSFLQNSTDGVDVSAIGASAVPQHPDVVVIGGGIAGLAAALRLKRDGVSVVVLEARDRLGGRIHSQSLERGGVIDLGAQFIGDVQRRISALVDEAGLTRVKPHLGGDSLYRTNAVDGKPKRFDDGQLPLSLLSQIDAYQASKRLGLRKVTDPAEYSRLDSITASAFIADLTFTEATNAFLLGFLESEFCLAGDEISALEMLEQIASIGGFEGEHASAQWFLAEGTGPLIQHLAAGLGSSIALNTQVMGMERKSDRMVIQTSKGSFAAREVVVAVPPQLYGRMQLMSWFSAAQQKVLSEYRLGTVIKTLLVFDTPWWREHGLSGRAASVGGLFNAMVDASPADASVGILVLFSTGPSGRLLAATRSETARIGLALEDLWSTVGKAPAPLFARSVDWNDDPWSLGGYGSRRGPGGWVHAPDLFHSRECIHFAGSETANEWRGFMEGALQSAERAAGAVLQSLLRAS